MTVAYFFGFRVGDGGQGNIDMYYTLQNDEEFLICHLTSQGNLDETRWDDEKKEMKVTGTSRESECDVYGLCGAFASCNSLRSPICSC